MSAMKGQVTLEYLILGAIGLSLILVSLVSLSSISKSFGEGRNILAFKDDVNRLYHAMSEVCILGSGNRRIVLIHGTIHVQKNGDVVVFENVDGALSEKNRIVKKLICSVEDTTVEGPRVAVDTNQITRAIQIVQITPTN